MAHAADGAGSIRIPASNCGLVGLKPTRGRVPDAPPLLAEMALAVPLCLSRTVRDTAHFLAQVERRDAAAPYRPVGRVSDAASRRLRIGLLLNGLSGQMPDTEILRALDHATRALSAAGHHVTETRWPLDGPAFLAAFTQVYALEGQALKLRLLRETGRDAAELAQYMEPASQAIDALGAMLPPQAAAQAFGHIAAPLRAYVGWFDDVDLVMSGVLLQPPVAIGVINGSQPLPFLMEKLAGYADYTMIQNAAGSPAISLPLHWTEQGLPVGVQFAARPGDERSLLEIAYELEKLLPWAGRRPPLWAPSRVRG